MSKSRGDMIEQHGGSDPKHTGYVASNIKLEGFTDVPIVHDSILDQAKFKFAKTLGNITDELLNGVLHKLHKTLITKYMGIGHTDPVIYFFASGTDLLPVVGEKMLNTKMLADSAASASLEVKNATKAIALGLSKKEHNTNIEAYQNGLEVLRKRGLLYVYKVTYGGKTESLDTAEADSHIGKKAAEADSHLREKAKKVSDTLTEQLEKDALNMNEHLSDLKMVIHMKEMKQTNTPIYKSHYTALISHYGKKNIDDIITEPTLSQKTDHELAEQLKHYTIHASLLKSGLINKYYTYQSKYLKYKQKYLELKKLMNQ